MEENREEHRIQIVNKASVFDILLSNKAIIYSILFYLAGLLIGAIIYKYTNQYCSSYIKEIFTTKQSSFLQLLINYFCIYFSAFTLTVLLGLCLVGFPLINLIPFVLGIEIALKISYFYITYSVKGIGYSLLMIIPQTTMFITILLLSIEKSNELSRNIYYIVSKKGDMTKEINLKSYLKAFLIFSLILIVISIINACCNYYLSSIISI